jgi:hypothetical protein
VLSSEALVTLFLTKNNKILYVVSFREEGAETWDLTERKKYKAWGNVNIRGAPKYVLM